MDFPFENCCKVFFLFHFSISEENVSLMTDQTWNIFLVEFSSDKRVRKWRVWCLDLDSKFRLCVGLRRLKFQMKMRGGTNSLWHLSLLEFSQFQELLLSVDWKGSQSINQSCEKGYQQLILVSLHGYPSLVEVTSLNWIKIFWITDKSIFLYFFHQKILIYNTDCISF